MNFEEPVLLKKRKSTTLLVVETSSVGHCAVQCNTAGDGCGAFSYRGSNLNCKLYKDDGNLFDLNDDTVGEKILTII